MPRIREENEVPRELEQWLDEKAQKFRDRYHRSGSSVANVLSLAFVLAIVFLIIWGAREFRDWLLSDSSVSEPDTSSKQVLESESLYEILGGHRDSVYLYNRSTQKIYRYDALLDKEVEFLDLLLYDAYTWSPDEEKIVFVSRRHNELGNLYLVNLAGSAPSLILLTKRESGISFPADVAIQADLPLAWNDDSDQIAFVGEKLEGEHTLFVVAVDGSQYYCLPEMDRITSVGWAAEKVVFVAFEDGQERVFTVNADGGALREIDD